MNVMEKCSVCFQTVETDIFIPQDECVELFNNFLGSLHSSIAEKSEIPFVSGSEFPFCKMCFDAAFQLNQVNEQLSAFQKQLSDLIVEFSLAVIYRRSQTTATTKNTCQKSKIEIDVTGLPETLFYFNNAENASDEESRMVEDIEPNIIAAHQNDVVLKAEHIERGNAVCPLEYSAEIEHENLFVFPNQAPVEEESVKPEITVGSCDSVAGNNICSACPGETEDDAHCLIGSNIVIEMKEQLSTDIDLAEFESDPLSLTEDQPIKIRKITTNRILSSQPGYIEVAKSRVSKLVPNPSIRIKRVSKRRPPNLSKSEGSNHSQQPILNHSDGRKEVTDFKHQRRTKKDESHSHSFVCEFCNKVFKSKQEEKDHRRTHTGERPYQCPFCSKAFKQSSHLAVHKRIHTGERPHKCFYCPKTFNSSSNKRKHQVSNHGDSR